MCKCNAGATGPDGGPCTLCAAGKYKAASGSAACDNCDAGKYSTTVGANSNTSCLNCPQSSTSAAGSTSMTSCTCNVGYDKVGTNPFTCEAGSCPAGYTGPDGSCTACTAGTYKALLGSAACDGCTAGKFSTATGQSSAATCQNCAAGKFSAPNASVCINCAPGSYFATTGSFECTKCPSNSSSPSGSIAVTACQCDAGFSGPNGGTCTACVAGYYKQTVGSVACTLCAANTYGINLAAVNASSCLACPENTTSVAGSSICQCKAGFSGQDGGPCEPCAAGFYKSVAGSAACVACPANSSSAVGSISVTSCKCNAGLTGSDGGPCSACAAGTYKNVSGSVACTLCEANTYGTAVASTSNASCLACPGNSTSVRGSNRAELCFCRAGFAQTLAFDACVECQPGYYDNITNRHECSRCGGGLFSEFWGATGSETCRACRPGTWSEVGSATCQLCPPNTNSSARSALLTDCKCLPGFTGADGETCTACEPFTYKATNGNATCETCAANSMSDYASATCQCLEGYSGPDGGNCSACAAGKYKDVLGSSQCSNCSVNAYSKPGAQAIWWCYCNAGYSSERGEDGQLNCTACASGLYKLEGNGDCQECPAFSAPGRGAAWCDCVAGYKLGDDGCEQCPVGAFKNKSGNVSQGCEVLDSCCRCPRNRTTLQAGTELLADCLCAPGFGGGVCRACAAGTYKSNVSMDECLSCPGGSGTLAEGATDVEACVATPGFYGNLSFGFALCANGSYSSSPNMSACEQCPAGATSVVGAKSPAQCVCSLPGWRAGGPNATSLCACEPGFARDALGTCALCARNFWCAGGDAPAQQCPNASVAAAGSAAQTDCVCAPGYSGPAGGPCVACRAGEWKAANGSAACAHCASNSTSAAASTAPEACLCDAGHTGPNGGPCAACAVGQYKAAAGSAACSNCSANTTTRSSATRAFADCLCVRGLALAGLRAGTNASICVACALGKYRDALSVPQVCATCPSHATTLMLGAQDASDCVCVPGRYSVRGADNSSSCQQCPADTFKAAASNSACTPCQASAASPVGSNSSAACLCVPGFSGATACSACLPGEYKSAAGSGACTKCATNSLSPAASVAATACVCNAGFVGPAGGPCTACARNTYALNNVCVSCPQNSESPQASAALADCKCLPGHGGTAGSACAPCGFGFYRGASDTQCVACPRRTNTTTATATSAAACVGVAGFFVGVVKAPSVQLTFVCPYSAEEFTDDVQVVFKQAVAAAAAAKCACLVSESDIIILEVAAYTAAARRLLQESVLVTYNVKVPTQDDGVELMQALAVTDINGALQARGVNTSTQNMSKLLLAEDVFYAMQCPNNTYKTTLGNTICTPCPAQAVAPPASVDKEACTCPSTLKRNIDGSCDRVCPAGFEARTDGGATACAGCLRNFYKPAAGEQACTPCPSNSFTLLANQTSINACLCLRGFVWNAITKLCDACPPGTSNNRDNERVCFRCNTTCPAQVTT